MSIVGKNIRRLDGADKVTGSALFTDDIEIPNMWHGAVVRTEAAHGRIKGVELDPTFDWSAVVTADASDIPGQNCVAMMDEGLPLIVTDEFKHIGEAVMLIAAPTRVLAREAVKHVTVLYDELPPILSIKDSKKAEVQIFGDDNVIAHFTMEKGDVASGFEAADEIVEGEYVVGFQEHVYIEPQAMIAMPRDGDGFDVIGSMQCPYYISKAMGVLMGMPEERISIKQATVGGAFGGKEDYPSVLSGYCMILARKAGRPVKITYDRDEDIEVTTKRHPAIIRHRTGVKRDGTITAMDIDVEMDAGAYKTISPVVLSRGIIHCAGPYRCENVDARAYAYATNIAPPGAFRGFGAPQVFFALEVHMDKVAEAIGISPLDFRMQNRLREGDSTATGQIVDESVASLEVLTAAADQSSFGDKYKTLPTLGDGRIRRGIGLSFFFHGAGFTGSGEDVMKSKGGLRLDEDGSMTILTACTEMGQGAHTVLPQMTADFLGVDIGCIGVATPDTAVVPNSGPTVASRTTMIMGSILEKCAVKMREKLFDYAADRFGIPTDKLEFDGDAIKTDKKELLQVSDLVKGYLNDRGALTIIEQYKLPEGRKWDEEKHRGDAYPSYGWGCDIAEVSVNMDTFEVSVDNMWLAQDIGRAINRRMVEGQIEGGTLQALGYATMERVVIDGGKFLTNKFQTYIIPTALDAPDMKSIIIEKPFAHGPRGAKGVGELPMDGGAPAIVNAIYHATGIRVCELPATPEMIFEEWKKVKKG
jgi:CO/xanthine dehydrogenase Mo-binding subunit